VTDDDLLVTGKIALAQLNESPTTARGSSGRKKRPAAN
jgi:hypothetical protein